MALAAGGERLREGDDDDDDDEKEQDRERDRDEPEPEEAEQDSEREDYPEEEREVERPWRGFAIISGCYCPWLLRSRSRRRGGGWRGACQWPRLRERPRECGCGARARARAWGFGTECCGGGSGGGGGRCHPAAPLPMVALLPPARANGVGGRKKRR
uniref:Uncharacterized protein n=1 Tax=Oryza meridionalis TaxID=40149 RepID=A0A0E0E864_9ORYZ